MKKLIMITNYFPYGSDTGEMYLRNEIFETSRIFDEVVILSCNAKKGDFLFTDNLPQNVQYFALDAGLSKISSIPMIFSSNYLMDDHKILCERKSNSFAKNCFLYYFLNKTKYRINRIHSLELFKSSKEDNVIIYSYRLFDLAMIAVFLKKQYYNNAMVISRAHGYDLYEEKNRLKYLPCRVYLMNNLDMIYPCSFDGEKYLRNKYKKYGNKVLCSYLGTKDYGFQEKTENSTLQVISCSNVIPVKRVEKIAAVMLELSKRIDLVWTHIGDGTDLEKIKRKYSNEISDGIMIFAGKQQHEQVIKQYQQKFYDLFINLSESEGIPQSIMEALSFGIPIVATNVGGNAEIVLDHYTGYLVEENEVIQQIANIIEKYSKMSISSVNLMRRNCRNRWKECFNAANNSIRFFEGIVH